MTAFGPAGVMLLGFIASIGAIAGSYLVAAVARRA